MATNLVEQRIKVSKVFHKNLSATTKIVVDQGGTRSSKTYSIAQVILLYYALEEKYTIDIFRESLPALKGSVYLDCLDILHKNNIKYHENKTEMVYTIADTGTQLRFLSLDDPQKIRGRKRDILWFNEANEFKYDAFKQGVLRTTFKVFLDFNPSDEFHWIYDKVLPRDDCTFIQSTYLDNPFLEPEIIREIERLKDEDPNYWRVYGLGERGVSQEIIYPTWAIGEPLPGAEVYYGLDFGHRVPTALVKISQKENIIHLKQIIYQTDLVTPDIIQLMRNAGIDRSTPIYADSAEPDRIEEIYRAGFDIHPAKKDVKSGIDAVKRHIILVDKDSPDLMKEIKHYKNKMDKNGIIIDEPVKFNDHSMDATRYGVFTHNNKSREMSVIQW